MLLISRKTFVTPVVFGVCLLGIALMQLPRLQKLLSGKQTTSLETLNKEIKSENLRLNFLKKMPSFGYSNLIGDWVYLNFLQYFGDDEVRDRTGYSLSPEYFAITLGRDPRFLAAYLSLSTSTSLYAGMPERSIALMNKGLKSLSPLVPDKSYYVWRYKGIDELLFLGDADAAEQSFLNAASWANKYPDQESKYIAFSSQRTAEFLSRNPNSKYAQIATWAMVLNNKVDDKIRKRVISKIEALGAKIIKRDDGTQEIILPPKD